ncbi:MAG TPA: hypothetical protein VIL48_15925 [Acidimicrobiales bacterium]
MGIRARPANSRVSLISSLRGRVMGRGQQPGRAGSVIVSVGDLEYLLERFG